MGLPTRGAASTEVDGQLVIKAQKEGAASRFRRSWSNRGKRLQRHHPRLFQSALGRIRTRRIGLRSGPAP